MFLTRMQKVRADGTTMVYLDPPTILVTLGKTFSINIDIDDVIDLAGFDFKLFWNTTTLDCVSVTLTPPWEPYILVKNEILENYNATHGRYWGAAALEAPAPAFSGNTTLATLTFKATAIGESVLDLNHVALANSDAKPIENWYYIDSPNDTDVVSAFARVPITAPSIDKLSFRLSIEPVEDEWLPDREYKVVLWDIAGRSLETLTKLTPQPLDDIVVKVWYFVVADTDGNGQLSEEELAKAVKEAIQDEIPVKLLELALKYSLELYSSAILQQAFVSLQGLVSGAWAGLEAAVPGLVAGAVISIAIVNPIKPMLLTGFSSFGYGAPWTKVGSELSPCDDPYTCTLSPVDLEMVDNEGRVVNKTCNQIPGAFYLEADLDEDGSLDDLIAFPETTVNYTLNLIPEPGANDNDTYTLILGSGGFGLILEENAIIGNISDIGYSLKVYNEDFLNNLTISDVAITNVALSHTVVGKGFNLSLSTLVENEGSLARNFNITLYANNTVIGTVANISLSGKNSTTVPFTWNTSEWAKGNYRISVHAWSVPMETGISSSFYVDFEVCVTIPGDVDSDRDVDIFDIVSMAGVYGDVFPPVWPIPPPDIDGDGDVDIYDIVIAAGNYGKSW